VECYGTITGRSNNGTMFFGSPHAGYACICPTPSGKMGGDYGFLSAVIQSTPNISIMRMKFTIILGHPAGIQTVGIRNKMCSFGGTIRHKSWPNRWRRSIT